MSEPFASWLWHHHHAYPLPASELQLPRALQILCDKVKTLVKTCANEMFAGTNSLGSGQLEMTDSQSFREKPEYIPAIKLLTTTILAAAKNLTLLHV